MEGFEEIFSASLYQMDGFPQMRRPETPLDLDDHVDYVLLSDVQADVVLPHKAQSQTGRGDL